MKVLKIVILLLLPLLGTAQIKNISIPEFTTYQYDSNYIESFVSKLALRFVIPKRTEQFRIRDAISGQKYTYGANEHYGLGVGFTYRWLAIDMTFNPNFTQRNNETYGRTKEFNLKGGVYLRRALIDVYFRSYKGYYVTNPEDNTPSWQQGMPFPQRADIKTTGWGVNYTYPFNWKKYTPRITYVQDGRLLKSAGSFITISSVYFYHLRADSSIVDDTFKPAAQINRWNIALLGQLFGYSYTYVYKDFSITGGAFPGVTFPIGTAFSENGGTNPMFTANFKIMIRAGISYNIEQWYTGFYMILDNNQTKLPDNLILGNTLGEYRFFFGYRIKAPKFLDNAMNKL